VENFIFTLFSKKKIWLEITTLVIPGKNDSDEELHSIASFIAGIEREIPWHVSAFHPTYKMNDVACTPVSTLQRAREIGREAGLYHVYVGNVPGSGGEHTWCKECNTLLLERFHFELISNNLVGGCCPKCSTPLAGVF